MNNIHKNALVPYSVSQMFSLVNDVEAYPEFLPWCKMARVAVRKHEVHATMTMSRGGLEKTFTTKNTFKKNAWIEIRLLRGPFKKLRGKWKFRALGEEGCEKGCKVSLEMDFEFSSKLLRTTLGPIFSGIINSLMEAFINRARELYGKDAARP
ncbi:MAG: type II toxin-antitoxin system RatA family toxin [Gammaproteobacteria bacterium]|nr:type II toxin-antitoxin system RatA family toxin [Gammaproteobacteria bacterium]